MITSKGFENIVNLSKLKEINLNECTIFDTFKTAVIFKIPELCEQCIDWLNNSNNNYNISLNTIDEMTNELLLETMSQELYTSVDCHNNDSNGHYSYNKYDYYLCQSMALYLDYFISQIEIICIKHKQLNSFDQLLTIFRIFTNVASLIPIEFRLCLWWRGCYS